MKKIVLVVLLIAAGTVVWAQEGLTGVQLAVNDVELTGNFALDAKLVQAQAYNDSAKIEQMYQERKKSPMLSALMSAVIPGTGDLYNGSGWWKTAAYLAVEAAAISVAIAYDNKGDDQTDFYKSFANAHWDVAQYAGWTVDNASRINSSVDASNYAVFNTDGSVNWTQLNKLENAIGEWYSHQLAPYGDQQYYEMIGKYQQFDTGWDDFEEDPDDPYTYGDELTANFHYYSDQRGKANDYYNVARWGVIVVVTNHLLSAIESAWSTSKYNQRLKMNLQMQKQQVGFKTEYCPQFSLQARF